MLSRITTVLLILAAVVVCSTTLAVEPCPVGVKATVAAPQPGSEVAVPATTEWGMFVMVLLVLTASTAAMLGGGFPSRVVRSMPTPSASPSLPRAAPQPQRSSAKSPGSPKNKSKRPFSHQAQARHDARQSAGRTNLSRSRRRREGPGCRGIR